MVIGLLKPSSSSYMGAASATLSGGRVDMDIARGGGSDGLGVVMGGGEELLPERWW